MEQKLSKIINTYNKINKNDLDTLIKKLFKDLVDYFYKRCDNTVNIDYIQDTVENMLMNLSRYVYHINIKNYIDRYYNRMIREYNIPEFLELSEDSIISDSIYQGDNKIEYELRGALDNIYESNIKCIESRKFNIMVYLSILFSSLNYEHISKRIFSVPRDEIYLNYIRYIALENIKHIRNTVNV